MVAITGVLFTRTIDLAPEMVIPGTAPRPLGSMQYNQVMFTIEQINDLHARLGKAETLLAYVRALNAIGVAKYDSYLTDGHSEYFGKRGHKVISPPAHDTLSIAEKSNEANFLRHLKLSEQGKTTYVEMSKGLAESGIEKWTVDTSEITMVFYDKAGNEMLAERIK
jgi:uncharacterized protein YbcV (DUF1398 family)